MCLGCHGAHHGDFPSPSPHVFPGLPHDLTLLFLPLLSVCCLMVCILPQLPEREHGRREMNGFRSERVKTSVFSQWIAVKADQRAPDGKSIPVSRKALLRGHSASATTGKSAFSSLKSPLLQVSKVPGCYVLVWGPACSLCEAPDGSSALENLCPADLGDSLTVFPLPLHTFRLSPSPLCRCWTI